MFLPSLRNHHENGFRQGPSGSQQKFQRVIQSACIRTIWLNHRKKRGQIIPKVVALHRPLSGLHPVSVAPERIDLSVVSDQPHRMCAIPTGKSVGRKSGVHHRKMTDVVGRLKIGKVIHQLQGAKHPFVDHDPTGERADIEHLCLGKRCLRAQFMTRCFSDQE